MSDFTGLTQDHYNAIAAERERDIARNARRREWKKITARNAPPPCCAADRETQRAAAPKPRPSPTP